MKNLKGIISLAIVLILILLYTIYISFSDNYDTLENILPPHFDNDLKFHSAEVCQRVKAPELFLEWKKINEQAQLLNEKYSSELLIKVASVIEQLKKNQQLYAESQGEGQQFVYTQKQLRECANKTNYTKKELNEFKQKTEQILQEQSSKIEQKKEKKNNDEAEFQGLQRQNQTLTYEISLIARELNDYIQQKERLRKSYRNQSQLQEHHNQLQQDIDALLLNLENQEKLIQSLQRDIQNQEFLTQQKLNDFENINTQLSDLKALEQYFRSDGLYIKEDIPIITVLKQYTNGLKIRLDNLNILAEKEKNPEQRLKNKQAKTEVEKALSISNHSHTILSEMKFECTGDCTIDTSFENITLLSMKEEIAKKQVHFNSIFREKSSNELKLNNLYQKLEREIQQNQIYKQKLSTLQEEQKLLDQNKNLQQEIERLTNLINELENKKTTKLDSLDTIIFKLSELSNNINLEEIIIDQFEKQKQDIESEGYKAYFEKNQELRKAVSDCIKLKKIYDYLILKQSKQIDQANQIKIHVGNEVQEIENLLNKYKDLFDELNLKSNRYEQIEKEGL